MFFFTCFTNKTGLAHNSKIMKTLMEFFHKIKFLTENTINNDVTFGVTLSTVRRQTFHIWNTYYVDIIVQTEVSNKK